MSTPADRPANAIPECGVNWMAWGAQPEGFLILRHMLPSLSFAQAIQNVSEPGQEQQVVAEYLPPGTHVPREKFEARGCRRASQAGASGRIRLSVHPRRVRAGVRRRFVFRATTVVGGRRRPVTRARVRFAGMRGRTGARGRARFRRRVRAPGRYRARAVKRGLRRGAVVVRVRRRCGASGGPHA